MPIKDNEAIYDEQIAPLMTKIIAICKEHEIPMLACFQYAPNDLCTSSLPFGGMSERIGKAVAIIYPKPAPTMTVTRNADGYVTNMTAIVG